MEIYKRLLAYLKPFRTRLVVASVCTLFYTLAHSLVSVTVFIVLNGLQNRDYVVINNLPKLTWLAKLHLQTPDISTLQFPAYLVPFVVVAVFLLRGIFEYISRYQMTVVGLRAVRKIRDDLYAHLVRLSMSFYSKGRTGELMSRAMNDVSTVQSSVTDDLVDLIRQPLIILLQIPLVSLTLLSFLACH